MPIPYKIFEHLGVDEKQAAFNSLILGKKICISIINSLLVHINWFQ